MATSEVNKDCPPAHQWTHNGNEVLILRCCDADGKSYNGPSRGKKTEICFQWPLEVGTVVEAPDWIADTKCGGGLHGWPWGLSFGSGKAPDYTGRWIVFGAQPSDVIELEEGKVKTRCGIIRFVGTWDAALSFILPGQMEWVHRRSRGAASSTGDSGAASSTGSSGAASSTGDSGAASSTGDSGAASSTGYSGAASCTGYSGAASSTGDSGAAFSTGLNSRARGGKYGCIALAWLNEKESRLEMQCAKIGCGDGSDGLLKAGVWYKLDECGAFVEIKD